MWQTPQASSRTSTSPARGSASSSSCTSSGSPNRSSTAARICTNAILRPLGSRPWRYEEAASAAGSGSRSPTTSSRARSATARPARSSPAASAPRTAALRSDEVTILDGEELLRTYQPEEGTAKTFCSVCGSNLFGGGWPESDQASIRLSAIDDPLPGAPAKHIYTRSLASWETLPEDGLERVDGSG